jgi:hypothetical protein
MRFEEGSIIIPIINRGLRTTPFKYRRTVSRGGRSLDFRGSEGTKGRKMIRKKSILFIKYTERMNKRIAAFGHKN